MSEPTAKKRLLKIQTPWKWPIRGVQFFILLGAVAVFTWGLAGSTREHSRIWQEGQVSPHTIYAPFPFNYSDQNRSIQMEKGELVVSKGERVTPAHMARLTVLEKLQSAFRTQFHWYGAFLLAFLFVLIGSIYLSQYERKVWDSSSQLFLVILMMGLLLVAARLMPEFSLPVIWIPAASVTLLLGMLLNPRVGIILGILISCLIGIVNQMELPWVVSLCVGCFIAAYFAGRIRRRMDFFRAGIVIGFFQAMTLLGSNLLFGVAWSLAFLQSGCGLVNGFCASVLTFFFLPLCESAFGLVTDVTLLEMSDLNHPLLRELSVKAPGTYHHSLIVASLAEAAAEAIGANALLARVGCYFHDIGKMLHPEYFVENQPPTSSRHDRLQPSMSSLVILNHVKDGVELARQYHLNQAIIDFIPGHHGTGLIYYFYRRALEEVEDGSLLKEERFRYPGPKPRSRETAIALLADSSEAATRAQKNKTPGRVQDVVRRIMNNKFIDGQLNDCDLTLRDLDKIAEAFERVLSGIYHSRIEYPKFPGEESSSAEVVG